MQVEDETAFVPLTNEWDRAVEESLLQGWTKVPIKNSHRIRMMTAFTSMQEIRDQSMGENVVVILRVGYDTWLHYPRSQIGLLNRSAYSNIIGSGTEMMGTAIIKIDSNPSVAEVVVSGATNPIQFTDLSNTVRMTFYFKWFGRGRGRDPDAAHLLVREHNADDICVRDLTEDSHQL